MIAISKVLLGIALNFDMAAAKFIIAASKLDAVLTLIPYAAVAGFAMSTSPIKDSIKMQSIKFV
jgi:hypothetical protein